MEEILNVKIEKLDHFGRGIVRDRGIIFVENTLPGDVVDIKITKDKKGIKEADVLRYQERSKFYRESICPYSLECGGCNIINLTYPEQLQYKRKKVEELIERMLKENIKVKDVITSDEEFNYRNKITLHLDNKHMGLYQKKSNDLVEIDRCALVPERINKIILRIKEYIKNNDVIIYDVTIKTTTLEEDMIIVHGRLDYEKFRKEFTDVKVIIINDQVVTKDQYIKERILDEEFYISNHSFFQVNRYTTKLLYQKVIDLIKDEKYEKCLDLYCGTGTISLLVSNYVQKVYGIEEEKDAITDAKRNKELNGRYNVEFIWGKTEDYIDKFSDIDIIIVDPPRAGLDKKTKDNLLRIGSSRIVYVSCDPATLMRDLNDLKRDYKICEISICDMFPNTYHIESIALLEKKR